MATTRQALQNWRRHREPSLRAIAAGEAWQAWHRSVNRWYDLRAVTAGYCNHCPYGALPGDGGGYAHWRCHLRRGHDGLHRLINYVWTDDGVTDYLPVSAGRAVSAPPWDRKRTMIPTRRQARQRARWDREQVARRRQENV